MKQCKNSEIKKLVKDEISKGGWFVMGRKHAKLYLSCGGFVTVPLTPSDKRSPLNFRTNLRRARQLQMSGGLTR